MRALGVTDHRFLGGAGPVPRQRHDGHAGQRPSAGVLARATPTRRCSTPRSRRRSRSIREVRPQVLVTYDDNGDYGHPDHIMAHRVATAAVERAADPGYGAGEPWRSRRSTGRPSRSRCCSRASTRWRATPNAVRGRPTSTSCRSASTTSWSRPSSTRTGFGDAEDGRAARAPHPDRRRRPVLRAVEHARPRGARASSTSGSPSGELGAEPRTPTVARRICSPGSASDRRHEPTGAPLGCWTGSAWSLLCRLRRARRRCSRAAVRAALRRHACSCRSRSWSRVAATSLLPRLARALVPSTPAAAAAVPGWLSGHAGRRAAAPAGGRRPRCPAAAACSG